MSETGAKAQIDSLQVLRAVAAISVFFFHYFAYLHDMLGLFDRNHFSVGAYGVDIFFVVSGFIICFASRSDTSPYAFMVKRVSRIVPLYYLLTFGVFAVALVAPFLLYSTTPNAENLVRSLLFIPYAKENGLVQPLLFLGWTLNYEMFFYLVFAFALLTGRWRVFTVLAVILALTLAGAVLKPTSVAGYFYTDGIMLNFVWGCLVYLAYERAPRLLTLARPLWPVAAGLILVQNFYPTGLPREITVGLPSMVLLAGLLTVDIGKGPVQSFFVTLGDASYSLYLIHPYILQALFKIAVPVLGTSWLAIGAASVLACVVTVAASILLYRLIERPTNILLRERLLPRKTAANTI
jgi:exopolysaccharide production protein ExoZ